MLGCPLGLLVDSCWVIVGFCVAKLGLTVDMMGAMVRDGVGIDGRDEGEKPDCGDESAGCRVGCAVGDIGD